LNFLKSAFIRAVEQIRCFSRKSGMRRDISYFQGNVLVLRRQGIYIKYGTYAFMLLFLLLAGKRLLNHDMMGGGAGGKAAGGSRIHRRIPARDIRFGASKRVFSFSTNTSRSYIHSLLLDPILQTLVGQSAHLEQIHRTAQQFFQVLFYDGGHEQIRGVCIEKNVQVTFRCGRTWGKRSKKP
jgi:hypothetical protein